MSAAVDVCVCERVSVGEGEGEGDHYHGERRREREREGECVRQAHSLQTTSGCRRCQTTKAASLPLSLSLTRYLSNNLSLRQFHL